ncbi:unnamed protein product [Durusdinium trenchii]|uniref:Secreted protein n=1 Tax=Durusdinium trenchii TaxID=1381693 RepID=A0ABP0MEP5_9DINO
MFLLLILTGLMAASLRSPPTLYLANNPGPRPNLQSSRATAQETREAKDWLSLAVGKEALLASLLPLWSCCRVGAGRGLNQVSKSRDPLGLEKCIDGALNSFTLVRALCSAATFRSGLVLKCVACWIQHRSGRPRQTCHSRASGRCA